MMVIWWWWYGDEDDDDDDDVIGDIVDDDDKDDFKGVVVAALVVHDPHQEDQGGEKGAADCIFFWSYINIYWISSFLYCWKQSRWRQWDIQFIVVKHLDFVKKESKCSTTTNCASPLVFVAKSANVYLATIIRLFLTASLTVAMYQKCTAFSPHVSSPHFYKYKNNCPTTPPRLLFNIYDGLSELTCRK